MIYGVRCRKRFALPSSNKKSSDLNHLIRKAMLRTGEAAES